MARDGKSRQAPRPTSITEIARRYHASAVALAQTLGLPLEAVLSQHRESVTAIFIEASRCELRLPAGVQLPPLVVAAPVVPANGQAVTPTAEVLRPGAASATTRPGSSSAWRRRPSATPRASGGCAPISASRGRSR